MKSIAKLKVTATFWLTERGTIFCIETLGQQNWRIKIGDEVQMQIEGAQKIFRVRSIDFADCTSKIAISLEPNIFKHEDTESFVGTVLMHIQS